MARLRRLLFRLFVRLVGICPWCVVYAVAAAVGRFVYCFDAKRRTGLAANLSVVLGPAADPRRRQNLVRTVFRNHAWTMAEHMALASMRRRDHEKRVTIVNRRYLDEALARGRGGVLVLPHVGNWEWAGAALAILGYPLNVVAGEQFSRDLSPLVKEMKKRLNIGVISPEGTFRSILRALHKNEFVALLLDGDVYEGGVEVEFFGRRAVLPSGAAVLALRTGAAIVCGATARQRPGHLTVVCHELIIADPDRDDEVSVTQHLAQYLEKPICDNIDQWCIFRPLWGAGDVVQ